MTDLREATAAETAYLHDSGSPAADIPPATAVAQLTLSGLGYAVTKRLAVGALGLVHGSWTLLTGLRGDVRIDLAFFAPRGRRAKFSSGRAYLRDSGDPHRFASPTGVLPRDGEAAEPFASLVLISLTEALRQAELFAHTQAAS